MAYFSGSNRSEIIDGTNYNDRLYGNGGDDLIRGFSGHDDLYGGSGNDDLYGGYGDDYLSGGSGRDELFGGSGHDDLRGGTGQDFLQGGYGQDAFIFDDGDSGVGFYNRDVITDFILDEDIIDLEEVDARTDLSGGQDFRFDGYESNPNNTDRGSISYRFVDGDTIISANTDSDSTIEFQIELYGTCDLASYDFFL